MGGGALPPLINGACSRRKRPQLWRGAANGTTSSLGSGAVSDGSSLRTAGSGQAVSVAPRPSREAQRRYGGRSGPIESWITLGVRVQRSVMSVPSTGLTSMIGVPST